MACMQKFGSSAQYVPVHSIKEVFSEVERGRANFGVVPIENTTEGVVNHTLDMFIDSNLLIYGEVLQEVSHHLLSKSGLVEEVKKIYSHPHAIAQCRNWLAKNANRDYADRVRIIYGGSMKPENARGLMKRNDVDGGLIGGAALKADSFLAIVNAAV